ncbi:MAG: EamA family transporter, partial [Synergistetes bacterium]|nr:EamA family transporter [Synergistota bacterium]
GIFMNLQPIVGMISASLILGEPLSFALLFGGTLILTGVYLVNRF